MVISIRLSVFGNNTLPCSGPGIALIGTGIGIVAFVLNSSMSLTEKVLTGGFYLGLALLFISVLRQRLIERKTDKYKDVEI